MEWLSSMYGKVIALDTAPIIYFIEKNPMYFPILEKFFKAFTEGNFRIVTSVVTLTEVLAHPLRLGKEELACEYRDFLLHSKGFTTVSFIPAIAEKAAWLRANYNTKTPDSIQIATAIYCQASFFVTNDLRLPSLPEIIILSLEKIRQNHEPK